MRRVAGLRLVKAHAYGNDFLLAVDPPEQTDLEHLARSICDRHRGLGADGLAIVHRGHDAIGMRLLNADGSLSELSGNGLRCVGTWLALVDDLPAGSRVTIQTGAGPKTLDLVSRAGNRAVFRTNLGRPEQLREVDLQVGQIPVRAVVLRLGNPQCVVLGPATEARLHNVAAGLATHAYFPEGTNVELAEVVTSREVRILIWERGVGPTSSSGTGSGAAAVAAAAFGDTSRIVDVVAPGGTQHVEWLEEGVFLTGWAEVVASAEWWQ